MMKSNFKRIIIVILAIIPLFVVGCSSTGVNSTTVIKTFNSSSDAYVVATGDPNWINSRDANICNHLTSPGTQIETSWYNDAYDIYRTFLYFDTSSIPDGARIKDVSLKLYISGVIYNQDDVSIFIISGNDDISFPAVCSDYDISKYNYNIIGSIRFSDLSIWKYHEIELNSNCIKNGGYTKFILLTDIDKNDVAPIGWNWMTFDGTNSVYCPKLEVSYTK
jgi:hypothetical protein